MSDSIKGTTALVTGAANRIGRAITLALAKSGIHVVVHYNTSDKQAEKTVTEALHSGVNAWKVQADLSVTSEVEQLISEAHDKAGSIDFLVNNASVFPETRLEDLHPDDLYTTLHINAVAPMLLARHFKRLTGTGAIINILDNRIDRIDNGHVSYQFSKNMLYTLTQMMAIDYAPGIRVNGIAPGIILPPVGKTDRIVNKQSSLTLLKRQGEVINITDTVLFLLSNTFITGEVIYIDGGQNLKDLHVRERQK